MIRIDKCKGLFRSIRVDLHLLEIQVARMLKVTKIKIIGLLGLMQKMIENMPAAQIAVSARPRRLKPEDDMS